MTTAGNITAVLTLKSKGFQDGLESSLSAVENFKKTLNSYNSLNFEKAVAEIKTHLMGLVSEIKQVNSALGNLNNFKQFSLGLQRISRSLVELSSDTINAERGITILNNIFKAWSNALNGVEVKIKGISNSVNSLSNTQRTSASVTRQVATATTQYHQGLTSLTKAMTQYKVGATNVQQSIRSSVSAFNSQYMAFEKVNAEAIKSREALVLYRSELMNLALGVERFNAIQTGNTARLRENQSALNQVASADSKVARLKQQVASASNQVSVSSGREAVAHDRATASINRQSTATRGLGRAMSSLKMMGTMVGSMIAYNFIHNLAMATNETINAKSEMNGYFQMLNFTTSQTQRFNKALDDTIKKFPRLNKYALGETISSIGVEFELTTKEMEKAMPVVSMITSEYLRAGRNVNEASLAVKDILQGEFQRLSRETGVKGDQLKEAGWSGDKSDVMGLLEALDKVGKERNWDTFVQKANSLNDAVLILQNRFSEWSADMVERVQPTILAVFNDILVVATDFGKAFNSVLDWLSGDGIAQSIVKWGGLAVAIGNVATGLAVYRTGANLTQLAKMGLLRTIGATIFGLEAETVANYGLRDSLVASMTQTDIATVKEYGRLNSIIATITGLKAEEVAEMGKTKALLSSILGLDMATVKQYSFTTALWSSISGIEAETIAMEGWNAQLAIAVAELGVVIGVIAVFTGALIHQAMVVNDNIEKYKKFLNMVNKGDSIINDAKESYESLSNRKQQLTEKLSTLKEGTYEYDKVANQLKTTTDDLSFATRNYEDAVNSVAWAKHKQELYDDSKASAQADAQKQINQALLDYGMNVDEARKLSNEYWNDAINGWNQHYETLQKVNLQYHKNAVAVQDSLNKMNEAKLDDKEVNILIRRKITAGNKIANAKEELGNATSLTEYVDKWLWLQVAQAENAIVDFDIRRATTGLGDAINGVLWGILHFFGDNFIGQFTQGIARDMGLEGAGKGLGDSLKSFLNSVTESLLTGLVGSGQVLIDSVSSWISENLGNIDIIGAVFNAFASSGDSTGGGYTGMKKIDTTWLVSYVNSTIIVPLTNFVNDPIGTISSWGLTLPSLDIGTFIQGILNFSSGGVDIGGVLSKVFNIDGIISYFNINLPTITTSVANTVTSVTTLFTNLKNAIWSRISSIVTNVTTGFTNLKNNAVSKITAMKDSVQGVIDKMVNAWNTMKNAILNSANAIMNGVKEKFDNVKTTIGGFYHKLTNPSEWFSGSGVREYSSSPKPQTARRLFAPVTRTAIHHGAGIDPYKGDKKQITLDELVRQLGGNKKVDLNGFLSLFENSGFGSWDFAKQHKDIIFGEGKKWRANSPSMNGIVLGDGFPVKRFWDGKASGFSWGEFMSVATAIFSTIPYRFYMDSDWKGNWVSALLSGAVNCSDGSDALLALASLFGFSGSKVHTNLKDGTGHFYTVINGHKLDTTHFQKSGSWSPLGGAGIPTRSASYNSGSGQTQGKTVNVHIDMSNSTIYGVDDLDDRIEESTKKAIREEFNDPYTVPI